MKKKTKRKHKQQKKGLKMKPLIREIFSNIQDLQCLQDFVALYFVIHTVIRARYFRKIQWIVDTVFYTDLRQVWGIFLCRI